MTQELTLHVDALEAMRRYPSPLFFRGNINLLHNKKISIVGSRKPNQYARHKTQEIAQKLSYAGLTVVSGGAIGVDAIAHKAAGASNTIMVAATGLDKHYPAINRTLIEDIEKEGLVLSQFSDGSPSTKYNFVLRNEVVVALGDILIVTYADLKSGTMKSVEYALKMNKKVFVLAHRIGESEATNRLLQNSQATPIYDIDLFIKELGYSLDTPKSDDPFYTFCSSNPTYEEALSKFPSKIFEAELSGEIFIKNGRVFLLQ